MSEKKYKIDEVKISISGVEMKPCKVDEIVIGVNGSKVTFWEQSSFSVDIDDFKVGDKVIRLDNNSPYIYTIQKIDGSLVTIVRKVRHQTWGTWLSFIQIKKATPKEIEQGVLDE